MPDFGVFVIQKTHSGAVVGAGIEQSADRGRFKIVLSSRAYRPRVEASGADLPGDTAATGTSDSAPVPATSVRHPPPPNPPSALAAAFLTPRPRFQFSAETRRPYRPCLELYRFPLRYVLIILQLSRSRGCLSSTDRILSLSTGPVYGLRQEVRIPLSGSSANLPRSYPVRKSRSRHGL